ncbi:MAG: hypothetical protein JKY45_09295 [Emcibacter sp.]|nr:hypothetical protein [Emcibacter sp.]
MGIGGYIAFGSAIVIGILCTALYYAGIWGLSEHDAAQAATFALEKNRLEQKYKDEKQAAVAAVQEEAIIRENALIANHKDIENDFTKQIAVANDRATTDPIAFGDDLLRDLIRVDCLWAAGEASADLGRRQDCSDEATNADPTSTGFYYTTFTPAVIENWTDACGDYPDGTVGDYFLKDWQEEYPGFDPRICTDTWVAFPPTMSKYISKFVANGESYTSRLVNYAIGLNEVIDKITKQKSKE